MAEVTHYTVDSRKPKSRKWVLDETREEGGRTWDEAHSVARFLEDRGYVVRLKPVCPFKPGDAVVLGAFPRPRLKNYIHGGKHFREYGRVLHTAPHPKIPDAFNVHVAFYGTRASLLKRPNFKDVYILRYLETSLLHWPLRKF